MPYAFENPANAYCKEDDKLARCDRELLVASVERKKSTDDHSEINWHEGTSACAQFEASGPKRSTTLPIRSAQTLYVSDVRG